MRKPSCLILWLDAATLARPLPASLQRLQRRGLQIRETPDYGPHKKYYPYVTSTPDHTLPLVTADDDALYPKRWLDELVGANSAAGAPSLEILCHRARRIEIINDQLSSYASWILVANTQPSHLNLPTGVGGVLYPPGMLSALRQAGDEFRQHCLRADDIWLHLVALRHGYRARQVSPVARAYPGIPHGTEIGLWHLNRDHGGNDEAIRMAYSPADIAKLNEENRRSA